MALSSWEMRQLQGIETFLAAADPKWAKRFDASTRAWRPQRLRRLFGRHWLWWSLLAAAWAGLVAAGVALGSVALIAAAAAAVIWAPVTALIVVSYKE